MILEVVAYLQEIRTIILKTETLFDVIKNELDKITKEILKSNENNFSAIANQYNFSRYLFLSKSNKLSVQELRKNYDTPQKVLDLCELLNIPH
nr:hypothetical protein [Flavobacterium covae]